MENENRPKKQGKIILLVILALALVYAAGHALTVALSQQGGTDGEQSVAEEEQPAPEIQAGTENKNGQAIDFTVYDADGNEMTLYGQLALGKPVILNFWASWCPPCRAEMPGFQAAYETYGDDVNFIMVNLTDGREETKETALAFLDENGLTFPVYYDTKSDAVNAYGITGIPTTIFIGPDGQVYGSNVGMIDEHNLTVAIEQTIEVSRNGE